MNLRINCSTILKNQQMCGNPGPNHHAQSPHVTPKQHVTSVQKFKTTRYSCHHHHSKIALESRVIKGINVDSTKQTGRQKELGLLTTRNIFLWSWQPLHQSKSRRKEKDQSFHMILNYCFCQRHVKTTLTARCKSLAKTRLRKCFCKNQ